MMRSLFHLCLMALIPVCLHAETAEDLAARLIANAWAPKQVRVEWTFNGKAPATLNQHDDWMLAEFNSTRIAGNVILVVQRKEKSTIEKVVVTGTARIFGQSLTVKQPVASGTPIAVSNLDSLEMDWTHLNGDPAQISDFSTPQNAARALVPGRVIITRDLKGANVILRGQIVDVQYVDGAVRIRFSARALKDGAAGETIPLTSNLVSAKHLSGTVAQDGTIQLVR
jgi:flagella basal body P-ring formation protein FlgA